MASWGAADGTIHHYSSSSSSTPVDGGHHDGGGIRTMLSRLSIESFDADADADEELSDVDNKYAKDETNILLGFSSSDSGAKEGLGGTCYSLPATPPRLQAYPSELVYHHHQQQLLVGIGHLKEYASENEAQQIKNTSTTRGRRLARRTRRRRSLLRPQRWIEKDAAAAASWDHDKDVVEAAAAAAAAAVAAAGDDDGISEEEDADDEEELISRGTGMGGWSWSNNNSNSFSGGESTESSGLMVITKPKGGTRSLCMDLEEVKACRDLGFELEVQEHMMRQPIRLSLSASTFDTATTSSAGSSPISNWRISSPGDDPRDVKARLKVWAQAVALASASQHTTT